MADDIDMRGGRRTDDLDELEQEERERKAKKKLTAKFHQFALDTPMHATEPRKQELADQQRFASWPFIESLYLRVPLKRTCAHLMPTLRPTKGRGHI